MSKIDIPSIDDIRSTVKQALLKYLSDPDERVTLYSKGKAAKLLDVSESTIDNLRVRGELPTTYIGSKPLFQHSDILDFISRQENIYCHENR